MFCTSPTLIPMRDSAARLSFTVMTGSPDTCSVFTSAAPGTARRTRLDAARDLQQGVEIVAEDLHADIAAHAGNQLVEPHLDRLRELVIVAGHLGHDLLDLRDHLRLGHGRVGPVGAGLEHDEGVGDVRRHRIGCDLGRADLGEHLAHLRNGAQRRLQLELHVHRLGEAGARDAHRVRRDVALVERGNELAAHARRDETGDRPRAAPPAKRPGRDCGSTRRAAARRSRARRA